MSHFFEYWQIDVCLLCWNFARNGSDVAIFKGGPDPRKKDTLFTGKRMGRSPRGFTIRVLSQQTTKQTNKQTKAKG